MSINYFNRLRTFLSVHLIDVPRHRELIKLNGNDYLTIHNRSDRIKVDESGAVQIIGDYTSELLSSKFAPNLGKRLLKRCIEEYRFNLSNSPQFNEIKDEEPDISVIIGHRGMQTLANLLNTIASFAAQIDVSLELIVVEQDSQPLIRDFLPQWVEYRFIRTADGEEKYCRSWGFNAGVKEARSKIVLLHDNDMLVPVDYCKEQVKAITQNYADVATLKRFIFYLTQKDSEAFFGTPDTNFKDYRPESIVQNLLGGGSITVRKEFYLNIGGFDEDFVGWGGEDNEFWQRCLSGRVEAFAFLPIVHLWHESQPGKRKAGGGGGAYTEALAQKKFNQPIEERIRILLARDFGNPDNPPRSTIN